MTHPVPPSRGGGAARRSEERKSPPLSDFRNMGHCVDHSPSLHEVQGPRVFSAMLTGDHAGVCNWHLSPAPLPCSRLRARGGAGRGGPAPHLPPPPRHLPVAGAASPSPPRVTSGSRGPRLAMTDLAQSRRNPAQSKSFAYICQTFCHFLGEKEKRKKAMRMNFKLLYV